MSYARKQRAQTQRMFLLDANRKSEQLWEFDIQGSRGIPYKIVMHTRGASCTCPDNSRSQGRCKHVFFISLRVLGEDRASLMMTKSMDDRLSNLLLPNDKQDDASTGEDTQQLKNKSCPICFDEFDSKEPVEVCHTCHHAAHKICITIWVKQKPTCPLCRGAWLSSVSTVKSTKPEILEQLRATHAREANERAEQERQLAEQVARASKRYRRYQRYHYEDEEEEEDEEEYAYRGW